MTSNTEQEHMDRLANRLLEKLELIGNCLDQCPGTWLPEDRRNLDWVEIHLNSIHYYLTDDKLKSIDPAAYFAGRPTT